MKNKLTFKIILTCLVFNSMIGYCQDAPKEELVIQNKYLTVKLDLTRGGAIKYISKAKEDRNIVNIHDEGRYIQQSYYAGRALDRQDEGQMKSWSPWRWNPIQVGDCYRNRAEILAAETQKNSLYTKCVPMLWDMNNKPAEATMEQWVSIKGKVITVKNRFVSNRTDDLYGENIKSHQELPAVYPISALKNLYSYLGDKPFEKEDLKNIEVVHLEDGFWGRYQNNQVTEHWMAFVDDNNWGMGVYCPISSNFLAGMSGKPGFEAKDGPTSYIAPVKTFAFKKRDVLEYTYYIIIDDLSKIRKEIYKLNKSAKN